MTLVHYDGCWRISEYHDRGMKLPHQSSEKSREPAEVSRGVNMSTYEEGGTLSQPFCLVCLEKRNLNV